MLDGFDDRTAYAQTIVAYTTGPDEEIHVFDGRTDGKIVAARGPTDFGWDPVFEPDEGQGKTYAEMSKDFKNRISHRGRSFEKFRAFLAKQKKTMAAILFQCKTDIHECTQSDNGSTQYRMNLPTT